MRVRMMTTAAGPAGVWPAGGVLEMDDAVARALVAGGYAVMVDAPRRIPDPPAPARAALVVPETPERKSGEIPRRARNDRKRG